MTEFTKKLSRLRTGKWLCLAAVVAAFFACYEAPDWFFEEDMPKDADGGGGGGGSHFNPNISYGSFTDGRDGKSYRSVRIGNQTWMAQNLDYDVPNVTSDVCYGNSASNCTKYGRLYNWSTAMNGASSSSAVPSGVRGVCPVNWHLPSDAEWTQLTDYVGSNAGTKLKSSTGWNSYSGVPAGADTYGFSALPGGDGISGGSFDDVGISASGGAPRRTMLPSLGPGTCTATSSTWAGTTATRQACLVFVVCRTEAA